MVNWVMFHRVLMLLFGLMIIGISGDLTVEQLGGIVGAGFIGTSVIGLQCK